MERCKPLSFRAFTRDDGGNKGFSLLEFLLASALGSILLIALAKFLLHATSTYQAQQDYQILMDEAITLNTILSAELKSAGDVSCLRLSEKNFANASPIPVQTQGGLKMLRVGQDALPRIFPKAAIPKLVPGSLLIMEEHPVGAFVNALYNAQTGYLEAAEGSDVAKDHLAIVTDCAQQWLFQPSYVRKHRSVVWVDFPFHLAAENKNYRLAHWQITLWFVMKNSANASSIYRLHLPDESAPVEIISDVHDLQAQVHLKNTSWMDAQANLDWAQVDAIRVTINLQKNMQRIAWPISVPLSIERGIRSL